MPIPPRSAPSPIPAIGDPPADQPGARIEALVRGALRPRAMLRERAERDDPHAALAFADIAAWARAEDAAPPVAGPPVHLRSFETRIPGLAARPTTVVMGWALCASAVAGGVLPDVPAHAWVGVAERGVTIGGCVVAAGAAVWGILSEVRGWHGSDAARWLTTRREGKARKARDARRLAIRETAVAVGADVVTVYGVEGHEVVAHAHPAAGVGAIAIERDGAHATLVLTTTTGVTARFDWLPADPAFAAAVERFAGAARARLEPPARVA